MNKLQSAAAGFLLAAVIAVPSTWALATSHTPSDIPQTQVQPVGVSIDLLLTKDELHDYNTELTRLIMLTEKLTTRTTELRKESAAD